MKNATNRLGRKFVVEYKSSRRQRKTVETSIWGDTNLKAITATVSHEMDTRDITEQGTVTPEAKVVECKTPAEADNRFSALTAASDENTERDNIASEPAKSAGPASQARIFATPKRKHKIRRQSRAIARPEKSPSPVAGGSIDTQLANMTLDEYDLLSMLEMENQRLKRLLLNKLQSENMLLRTMLSRFKT